MKAAPLPISLCIVNYNGSAYLHATLQAALSEPSGFAEILLIDNASTDDGLAVVRAHYPSVRILELPRNEGPGAARNAGFTAAACDLILFQDNDVRLEPHCASTLLALLEREALALLVAPRVVYERTPHVIQYDSADCHFLGLMALRNADEPLARAASASSITTSLVTACFLMDRRRWTGGLLFDDEFVFNYEDHDFGVRANLQGLQTWVEPAAVVRHGDGTAGLSYRPGNRVASRRVYYLMRNRWLVLGKSFALRTLLLLAPLLVLYELFQLAGAIRKGWMRQWWQALRYVLRNRAAICRKRAIVQRSRRQSDRLLLRGGPLPFTIALRSGRPERFAVAVLQWIADVYWVIVRGFI